MLLVLLSLNLMAEEHEHAHEGWEVGVSVGYATLKTENKEGTNLHLHLMHGLGDIGFLENVSVGLGAETIRTDEKHYGLMLTLAFNPIKNLTLGIAPGFEWAKHDGMNWEREYATHYEAVYSFEIAEGYHMGPVIDYSKTKEAEHYAFGLHFGIEL